jgi:hypothetical protein
MGKFTDKALKFFFGHINLWIVISFISLNFGSFVLLLTIKRHEQVYMNSSIVSWVTLLNVWTYLRIMKHHYENKQLFKD